MKKVLFIGLVWPEPTSTAAGGRIIKLIDIFKNEGIEVYFASAASTSQRSADLESIGVKTSEITLNDASFNGFVKDLHPEFVVFDRFLSEEHFGWRVAEHAPKAMRILDSEDLHFLRNAREKAVKKGEEVSAAILETDLAKRELASIYRCDLTLIISEYEMELLKNRFHIPSHILFYLPLLIDSDSLESFEENEGFATRKGFMTIGNFKHAPNYDSVRYIKKEIWPLIKKKLPNAEFHVYGAYVTESAMEWNYPKDGFLLHGAVPDSSEVFQKARVCLAPLRFGAGIKGKFIEAMLNGTPSVTTALGAEGMNGDLPWNGPLEDKPEDIANAAVALYNDEKSWVNAQENGYKILKDRFSEEQFINSLTIRVNEIEDSLVAHRNSNFVGEMMHFHTLRSTEFLSRWIELKNKKE